MTNPAATIKGWKKWRADPEAGKKRNEAIITTRKGGATLAECGRLFSISTERVRQICVKAKRKEEEEP